MALPIVAGDTDWYAEFDAYMATKADDTELTTALLAYISKSEAALQYLSQSSAALNYLTQSAAALTYITSADIDLSSYLPKSEASTVYLSQVTAASQYLTQIAATLALADKVSSADLIGETTWRTYWDNIRFRKGTFAARPPFTDPMGFYYATDTGAVYFNSGTAWITIVEATDTGWITSNTGFTFATGWSTLVTKYRVRNGLATLYFQVLRATSILALPTSGDVTNTNIFTAMPAVLRPVQNAFWYQGSLGRSCGGLISPTTIALASVGNGAVDINIGDDISGYCPSYPLN